MNSHSMEVFAEVHRERLVEEAEARRLLKAAHRADAAEPMRRAARPGAIARALAWLARLTGPDRPAAAS